MKGMFIEVYKVQQNIFIVRKAISINPTFFSTFHFANRVSPNPVDHVFGWPKAIGRKYISEFSHCCTCMIQQIESISACGK